MPVEHPVISTAFETVVVMTGQLDGSHPSGQCASGGDALKGPDTAGTVAPPPHGLQGHVESSPHRVPHAGEPAQARARDVAALDGAGALRPDAGAQRGTAALR